MNEFWLLFLDELRHFSRTRFFVWVCVLVPLLTVSYPFIYFGDSDATIQMTSLLVNLCQIGCIIAGCNLIASLVHDIDKRTFVPFLVRPVSVFSALVSRQAAMVASIFCIIALSIITAKALLASFFSGAITDNSFMYLSLVVLAQIVMSAGIGAILGVTQSSAATGMLAFIFLNNMVTMCLFFFSDTFLVAWLGGKLQGGLAMLFISIVAAAAISVPASKKLKEKVL